MGGYGNHFGNNWQQGGIVPPVEVPPQVGVNERVRLEPSTMVIPEMLRFRLAVTIPRHEHLKITLGIIIRRYEVLRATIVGIVRHEKLIMPLDLIRLQFENLFLDVTASKPEIIQFKPNFIFTMSGLKRIAQRKVDKKEVLKKFLRMEIKGAAKRGKARLIATTTNKKLDKIQNSTQTYLEDLAQKFIRSDKPVLELMGIHSVEIMEHLIASTARAYFAGFDYIQHVTGQKMKLTNEDVMKVKELAKKTLDGFWNTVTKGREEKLREKNDLPKNAKEAMIKGASAFDFIKTLVATLMNISVNQGTVESAKRFTHDEFADSDFIKMATEEPTYEFVTMRDERVDCKICKKLDGVLMKPNDAIFAIPPLHANCRCRLLLRLDGETLSS